LPVSHKAAQQRRPAKQKKPAFSSGLLIFENAGLQALPSSPFKKWFG
jgi:hypothetical protein